VVWTVRSGEDAAFAQPVHDVRCLRGRGLVCFTIADEIKAEEESGAASVAENLVPSLKLARPASQ